MPDCLAAEDLRVEMPMRIRLVKLEEGLDFSTASSVSPSRVGASKTEIYRFLRLVWLSPDPTCEYPVIDPNGFIA